MHQPQSFSHVVAFGMSSRPAAGVTHALFAHRNAAGAGGAGGGGAGGGGGGVAVSLPEGA